MTSGGLILVGMVWTVLNMVTGFVIRDRFQQMGEIGEMWDRYGDVVNRFVMVRFRFRFVNGRLVIVILIVAV